MRSTKSSASAIPSSTQSPASLAAGVSSLSLASGGDAGDADADDEERIRVVYMTEQISHHPPVSAYHASCPARGLTLAGIDQISAKVSGTTLRVAPGAHNKGIYIRIGTPGAGEGGGKENGDGEERRKGEGEEYHITHPVASVNGILRGSFYLTVGDSTVVTCTGGRGDEWLRAVVEYKEEVGLSPFCFFGLFSPPPSFFLWGLMPLPWGLIPLLTDCCVF